MKSSVGGLALKVRPEVTRKWPIRAESRVIKRSFANFTFFQQRPSYCHTF